MKNVNKTNNKSNIKKNESIKSLIKYNYIFINSI